MTKKTEKNNNSKKSNLVFNAFLLGSLTAGITDKIVKEILNPKIVEQKENNKMIFGNIEIEFGEIHIFINQDQDTIQIDKKEVIFFLKKLNEFIKQNESELK